MKVSMICAALLMANFVAYSQQDEDYLFDLSLEELMNIEIVSASKKAESLFDAPVSSYIISSDEILNSGATSIPDALKF